jgi:hypothetical protein
MASSRIDWAALAGRFPAPLIGRLRQYFEDGPFEIRAHQLAVQVNTDDATAEKLLQQLGAAGALAIKEAFLCSCDRRQPLTSEQAAQDVCPECGRAFVEDVGALPSRGEFYVNDAPRSRDVRWLLALHGMNTRGTWQEAFNWLVSQAYRRSVPVAIYKYGVVRPGVLLKFRQRVLIRELRGRIQRLAGQSEGSGFGGLPDVIAHSFGTWLLGYALQEDGSLRVGRVVLTGCILPPNFDWAALIARGQVEAVFCHTASNDFWARIAHYIIPKSGPAGVRGFNDRIRIGHATLQGGHHSDFFDENKMSQLFSDVWQPFLTEPLGSSVSTSETLPPADWEAACWPFRATLLRIFVLALLFVIIVVIGATFALGVADLWELAKPLYENCLR